MTEKLNRMRWILLQDARFTLSVSYNRRHFKPPTGVRRYFLKLAGSHVL